MVCKGRLFQTRRSDDSGGLSVKTSTLHSDTHDGDSGRSSQVFPTSSLEAPWPSKVCNLRQRTSVRSSLHPRTLPSARNPPQPSILRQTDRRSVLTKSWTSISGYLWTNSKTIGMTYYPWQNSSTTIMSTLLPNSLHSCLIPDSFLVWASNSDRTLLV